MAFYDIWIGQSKTIFIKNRASNLARLRTHVQKRLMPPVWSHHQLLLQLIIIGVYIFWSRALAPRNVLVSSSVTSA